MRCMIRFNSNDLTVIGSIHFLD